MFSKFYKFLSVDQEIFKQFNLTVKHKVGKNRYQHTGDEMRRVRRRKRRDAKVETARSFLHARMNKGITKKHIMNNLHI